MRGLGVVAVVLVAACGREAPKPAPSRHGAAVRAALALLPKDAGAVFGVDLARARRSAIWKRYGDAIDALERGPAAALVECGLDPLRHVTRATVAIDLDAPQPGRGALAVVSGVARAKLDACMEVRKLAIAEQAGLTVYGAGDEVGRVRWVAPDTALLHPGALELASGLTAPGGAEASPRLAGLFELVDSDATLWGVGALPEETREELRTMGHVPDGFVLDVDLADAVRLGLGLRYETVEAATSSLKLFEVLLEELRAKPPMALVGEIAPGVRLTRSGAVVQASATITADQLDRLVAMASSMSGGWAPVDPPAAPPAPAPAPPAPAAPAPAAR
jgi:hypothetical protein